MIVMCVFCSAVAVIEVYAVIESCTTNQISALSVVDRPNPMSTLIFVGMVGLMGVV